MENVSIVFTQRIWKCIKKALPKAGKTCIWLLKIILPVSLLMRLLQYSGFLAEFAVVLEPVFSIIGLPGESAIIFITSVFCPLYAPIALITAIPFGIREATILTLMCLISHNLVVESAVQAKTGSSFWGMTALRLAMSFVMAFVLNRIMPVEGWGKIAITESAEACNSIGEVLTLWFLSSMGVVITILCIVTSLMILHYILEEFNLMKGLSRIFAPLMTLFGLPKDASFLWLVGNLVGLAYGGAIMKEQMEQKKLSYSNGNLLNYHLAMSHSLLEDTIIFVAIGIPVLWIIIPRLCFAVTVVWAKRGYDYFSRRIVRQPVPLK